VGSQPIEIEQKPWGVTALLFSDSITQVNHISVCEGGFSSKHFHKHKVNVFVVCSGELLVYLFNEHLQPTKQHVLRSGDTLVVPARVIHQFCATEQTNAYELYYGSSGGELFPNDITRLSVNGVVAAKDCDGANERTQPRSGA